MTDRPALWGLSETGDEAGGTARAVRSIPHAQAPARRWRRLGLAGILGFLAGTMLWPTRAEGETRDRRAR